MRVKVVDIAPIVQKAVKVVELAGNLITPLTMALPNINT